MAITSRLVGKFGGAEVKTYPFAVNLNRDNKTESVEVFQVPGDEGVEYWVTAEGQHTNSNSLDNQQFRWRVNEGTWTRLDRNNRNKWTSFTFPARAGDVLEMEKGNSGSGTSGRESFVGTISVTPKSDPLEFGPEQTFSVSAFGRGNGVFHPLTDMAPEEGEVWKVKVTGSFSWEDWMKSSYYPTIYIGSSGSLRTNQGIIFDHEGYLLHPFPSGVSMVTDLNSPDVEFNGTMSIRKAKL